jgi:tRNA-guanine family transglycosylase
MSGATLISIHNVRFLIRQAQLCREAIIEGRFKEYFLEFAANMGKELGT